MFIWCWCWLYIIAMECISELCHVTGMLLGLTAQNALTLYENVMLNCHHLTKHCMSKRRRILLCNNGLISQLAASLRLMLV